VCDVDIIDGEQCTFALEKKGKYLPIEYRIRTTLFKVRQKSDVLSQSVIYSLLRGNTTLNVQKFPIMVH
jgi:hypothetical protein